MNVMRIRLISMLDKALRGERGSKETKASCFGTTDRASLLGIFCGIIHISLISLISWFAIFVLVSCGSSRSLSKEKVNEKVVSATNADSIGETTRTKNSSILTESTDSSNREKEEEKTDSQYKEVLTITETTIYDASSTENGAPKIKQTIKQTKVEKFGSYSNTKNRDTSATKNEKKALTKEEKRDSAKSTKQYANEEKKERNVESDKKQSISESKQIFYIALALFGIVLVIIVGVLAYWVFSKYRRRNNK